MKKVSTRMTENYERSKKSCNRRQKKIHLAAKKASYDDEKSFNCGAVSHGRQTKKLQPAVTKATTDIEKSFKLIVLAVNPAMAMTSFCCNHSRFCYKRRWNLLQTFFTATCCCSAELPRLPMAIVAAVPFREEKGSTVAAPRVVGCSSDVVGFDECRQSSGGADPSKSGQGQPDRLIPMAVAPWEVSGRRSLAMAAGRERERDERREEEKQEGEDARGRALHPTCR